MLSKTFFGRPTGGEREREQGRSQERDRYNDYFRDGLLSLADRVSRHHFSNTPGEGGGDGAGRGKTAFRLNRAAKWLA